MYDTLIQINAVLMLAALVMGAIARKIPHDNNGNGWALKHLIGGYTSARNALKLMLKLEAPSEPMREAAAECEQKMDSAASLKGEARCAAVEGAMDAAARFADEAKESAPALAAEVLENADKARSQIHQWWQLTQPKEEVKPAVQQPTIGVRAGIAATAVCAILLLWLEGWQTEMWLILIALLYAIAEEGIYCARKMKALEGERR